MNYRWIIKFDKISNRWILETNYLSKKKNWMLSDGKTFSYLIKNQKLAKNKFQIDRTWRKNLLCSRGYTVRIDLEDIVLMVVYK